MASTHQHPSRGATLLLAAALTASILIAAGPPASASQHECGGAWIGTDSCVFIFNGTWPPGGINVTATAVGVSPSVTVMAVDLDPSANNAIIVQCAATGFAVAACSASESNFVTGSDDFECVVFGAGVGIPAGTYGCDVT